MKKFSKVIIFAMAMVLTMGFVSCNNEPKEKDVIPDYVLKTGPDINKIFLEEDKLNAKAATAFAKATAAPETAEFYLDINETNVPVWYDEATTTIYYYIESGKKLILNEDSSYMFNGKSYSDPSNFVSIETSDFYTSKVKDMKFMFNYCTSLESLDLSNFDTSNVENMRYMFQRCASLESLDLSSFDTSNVQNMSYMFSAVSKIKELDLSNFNTSKVTDMQYMFQACRKLTSLDLSNFDTSNVTDMHGIFNGCSELSILDISTFNTSKVTDIGAMFSGCRSLEKIDIRHFDTSNVTTLVNMFNHCTKFKTIDLSSFDISNVASTKWMFNGCSVLEKVYVSQNADWSKSAIIEDSTEMFSDCTKLVGGAGTVFDAEKLDKTYARVDGGTTAPGYFTVKPAN